MDSRAVRTFRVFVVATAAVAVVLGVVALVWPHPSLVVVALLFGVYLVVAGALRVFAAVRGHGTPALWRWTSAVVGVLVAAAGLATLVAPIGVLVVYAVLTGIGFLVEGAAALVGAFAGHPGSSRVPSVVSGVLSIAAGVVVLLAPGLALTVFVLVAGVVLVVVGLATLLLLPARAAVRR